jgi:hypothetical protein
MQMLIEHRHGDIEDQRGEDASLWRAGKGVPDLAEFRKQSARSPSSVGLETFTAAQGIVEDYCAPLLNALAPLLSSALLAKATVVNPHTSAAVLTKLLQEGRSELLPSQEATLLGLLRSSFEHVDRDVCLGIIKAVAPVISDVGGLAAVQDVARAIEDVYRWWP